MRGKIIISFLIVMVGFSGCSFTLPSYGVRFPEADRIVPEMYTPLGYEVWILENISYAEDETVWGVREHWQTPDITIQMGSGDCEDMAILLMYLIETRIGDGSEMWILGNHSSVMYNHDLFFDLGGSLSSTVSYERAIRKAIRDSN